MAREPWDGGYIHRQKDGRQLFIIERRVGRKRFHVSTRAHSWSAALEQLKKFEADPEAYMASMRGGRAVEAESLRLTRKLADDFRTWQLTRPKPVTTKHAQEMAHRLADWMEDLAGVDLRRATLRDHIKPALERRGTCRQHRIIALKAFYKWLRTEKHLLRSAEDPSLDLMVPQGQPEKWKRRKAVPFATVRAAAGGLAPAYRDPLIVLAATGWHVTELERFARSEDAEIVYARRDETIAVLVTMHKVGEFTRTPVTDPAVLAAAERIRAARTLPRRMNDAIKSACRAVGVAPFTLGVMRHSVGTWAVEGGAVPALVSEFLGHKDPRTTKRFYIDVAVPTSQVRLPRI